MRYHPTALDQPLALQLESEPDEERHRGREVDHDAHVLHAWIVMRSTVARPWVFDGRDVPRRAQY
jgi:hypothetical protein